MTSAKPPKIDTFIQRASGIAQILLCVLGVVGLYYTVIPLYKSALLEESIARKTKDLEVLESRLEAEYVKSRTDYVRRFVGNVYATCAGLMEPPPNTADDILKDHRNAWERPGIAENLEECMKKATTKHKLEELRPADRDLVMSRIEQVTKTLESDRVQALKEVKQVPQWANTNPDSLAQPSAFSAAGLELYKRLYPSNPSAVARYSIELRVADTQMEIIRKYHQKLRDQMVAIADGPWPADPVDRQSSD